MASRTERQVLLLLRDRGAKGLERVRFRENRSTIWSLTREGKALNLHAAFRTAPLEILEGFAVITTEAHGRTGAFRAAAASVRGWDGLGPALLRAREEQRRRPAVRPRPHRRWKVGPCCATTEQRIYLQDLYAFLNRTRFEGLLPAGIPVRLSSRMTSRLGQMVPGRVNGSRTVIELALNVDLMLEGNGFDRIDTLVHEMAHAAYWLVEGGSGHGPGWRRWARRAGCRERACARGPIRRREVRAMGVTRVPVPPVDVGRR